MATVDNIQGYRQKFAEIKQMFENNTVGIEENLTLTNQSNESFTKISKKSKVKEMVSLFDLKVVEAMDSLEVKLPVKTALTQTSHITKLKRELETAAITSAEMKAQQNCKTNFVAEEELANFTVKDKIQFYNQFINEMCKSNDKFVQSAVLIKEENIEENIEEKKKENDEIRGEVIEEKQASVKYLVAQLEPKTAEPNNAGSPKRLPPKSNTPNESVIKTKNENKNVSTTSIRELGFKRNNEDKNFCQQLVNLFIDWLKENGHDQNLDNFELYEKIANSNLDPLLEETLAKLCTITIQQKTKDMDNQNFNTKLVNDRNKLAPEHNEESECYSTDRTKITSDESQTESAAETPTEKQSDADYENDHLEKSTRKKKLKRILSCKKNELAEATNSPNNSTDSDSEIKVAEAKTENKIYFLQPLATNKTNQTEFPMQPSSSDELDANLIRDVNSPRKIKSAYTLTAYSSSASSSPCQERKDKPEYFKGETSLNSSSTIETSSNSVKKASSLGEKTGIAGNMMDSFIDQGFETGSNDMESLLFADEENKQCHSPVTSLAPKTPGRSNITAENPAGFSTPIQGQKDTNQCINNLSQQPFCLSPIAIPLKSRGKSMYDTESIRSSLPMQVIREDQALEHHEIISPSNISEQNFFGPTAAGNLNINSTQKTSQLWLKSNELSLIFDIFYHDADRVRLLYEIFSQKSFDNNKQISFGIDNLRFSLDHGYEQQNSSNRLPLSQKCSYYWFAIGNMAMPFVGQHLTTNRIQHIFEFLKSSVTERDSIRFGIDAVEFSNVCEFWNQSQKFSMDSNYSMLVGLQSGNSNGLEGRSKYAWPNTKHSKVSDLDQSNHEADDFEEADSTRLLFSSPLDGKQYDCSTTSTPNDISANNDPFLKYNNLFDLNNEKESLDNLFDIKYKDLPSPKLSVDNKAPLLLKTLSTEKERLSLLNKKLHIDNQFSSEALNALKGTPQYMQRLKNIVTDIIHSEQRNNFKGCNIQELENYMYFLCHYADICMHNSKDHKEKLLDALLDRRAGGV